MFRFNIARNDEHYFTIRCNNEHLFDVIAWNATMIRYCEIDSIYELSTSIDNKNIWMLVRVRIENSESMFARMSAIARIKASMDNYYTNKGALSGIVIVSVGGDAHYSQNSSLICTICINTWLSNIQNITCYANERLHGLIKMHTRDLYATPNIVTSGTLKGNIHEFTLPAQQIRETVLYATPPKDWGTVSERYKSWDDVLRLNNWGELETNIST